MGILPMSYEYCSLNEMTRGCPKSFEEKKRTVSFLNHRYEPNKMEMLVSVFEIVGKAISCWCVQTCHNTLL
jgi:hypothetical protein